MEDDDAFAWSPKERNLSSQGGRKQKLTTTTDQENGLPAVSVLSQFKS
jgi:hypothetical protein